MQNGPTHEAGAALDRWTAGAVRFLLDATLDGVVAVGTDGNIAMCNRAAARLLGVPAADMVGHPASEMLATADTADTLARALRGTSLDGSRTTLLRTDGTTVAVRLSSSAVDQLIVLVLQDESERDETQAVLAESQARLRDLQSLGRVGLWRWSPATDEVQWSEQLYRIHDVDPLVFDGTLAGHTDPIRPDARDEVRLALQEAATTGSSLRVEYPIVQRDGHERWVSCRADPVLDAEGRLAAMTGIIQDVTADRQARAAVEAANARLERFASAVAHDLRDPLATIAGFAQLLAQRGVLEGDDAGLLERIQNNSERVLGLVGDILVAARRQVDEPAAPVDLDSIVHWVLDTLAQRIEQTDSVVETTAMPTVLGHEGLLRQALLNLVGNAVKYRHGGRGARIRISSVPVGRLVELRVDDDGPGIPEAERSMVFDDGYRSQRDIERGILGSGLGLATVREIAERHGAPLTVSDSDLGGARITLRLRPAHASTGDVTKGTVDA